MFTMPSSPMIWTSSMPASMDLVSSLIALSLRMLASSVISKPMCTYQSIRLSDLFRRLLEPSLCRVDLAIAAVNVVLHIPHIVKVKAPSPLLVGVGILVLGFEGFVVDLGAGTQFVFCVGEEIVGAVPDEVRAADFGVGDAELRRALVGSRHRLLAHELLCVGLVVREDT
jgi:hypothetical protein